MENNGFSQTSPPNTPPEFNIFPLVGEVFKLLKVEKPGQGFGELEQVLLESGLFISKQILLLPEDVLSAISDIGRPQARILHNFAKRVVLPLLGLLRNHEEPKIERDPEEENKRVRHSEVAENVLDCGNNTEVEENEDSDINDEWWEVIN